MFQPTVHNMLGMSSSWISGNYCHIADHTMQFVHAQPNGMHRCISNPYLDHCNYQTSPPESMPGGMPQYSQRNQMNFHISSPPEPCLTHHRLQSGLPNSQFKVGGTGCSAVGLPRKMQGMKLTENQQQNGKSESQNICHEVGEKPEKKYVDNQENYWKDLHEKQSIELEEMRQQCVACWNYTDRVHANQELKKTKELEKIEDTMRKLEIKVNEKEALNKRLTKKLTEKEAILDQLELKNAELTRRLENIVFKTRNSKDLQDSREENDYLVLQLSKARDELDLLSARTQISQQKYKNETAELKERLQREKYSAIKLTQDNKKKDSRIETLTRQLKEVEAQKQSMLKERQQMCEKMKLCKEESAATEGRKAVQEQLIEEMVAAIALMKNLAQFCVQDNLGEEMSVSVILGTHAQPFPYSLMASHDSFDELLSHQLQEVKNIQDEMRKLQDILSTKYAIRVGSQLNL